MALKLCALLEAEGPWKARVAALRQLEELFTVPVSIDLEDANLQLSLASALKVQLGDLRSVVVRESCRTLSAIVRVCRDRCRPLCQNLVPYLVEISASGNKVISGYAQECLHNVLEHVHVGHILTRIVQLLSSSKSRAVRECCMEAVHIMLASWDERYLVRDESHYAKAIVAGTQDGSANTRATARLCYWSFAARFPASAPGVRGQLDGRTQRILGREEAKMRRGPVPAQAAAAAADAAAGTNAAAAEAKQDTVAAGDASQQRQQAPSPPPPFAPPPLRRRMSVEDKAAMAIQALSRGHLTRSFSRTELPLDSPKAHGGKAALPAAAANTAAAPPQTPTAAAPAPATPATDLESPLGSAPDSVPSLLVGTGLFPASPPPPSSPPVAAARPPSPPRTSPRAPRARGRPRSSSPHSLSPSQLRRRKTAHGEHRGRGARAATAHQGSSGGGAAASRVAAASRSPSAGALQQLPRPGHSVYVLLKSGDRAHAICRFAGETSFATGVWVGVELDAPIGRNDGSVAGVSYFRCHSKHGLFVRLSQVYSSATAGEAEPQQASSPLPNIVTSFETSAQSPAPAAGKTQPDTRVAAAGSVSAFPPCNPSPLAGLTDEQAAATAAAILDAHRVHVDQVLQQLRDEMALMTKFEAQLAASSPGSGRSAMEEYVSQSMAAFTCREGFLRELGSSVISLTSKSESKTAQ